MQTQSISRVLGNRYLFLHQCPPLSRPPQTLFGADYPFQPLESVSLINESLEALNLSSEDQGAIEAKNLLRILRHP